VLLQEFGRHDLGIIDALSDSQHEAVQGHQARTPGVFFFEPFDVAQRGLILLALKHPVELLQISEQVRAAKFDLLAGSTRARRIGIQGHD
jgi:hypothetical protein